MPHRKRGGSVGAVAAEPSQGASSAEQPTVASAEGSSAPSSSTAEEQEPADQADSGDSPAKGTPTAALQAQDDSSSASDGSSSPPSRAASEFNISQDISKLVFGVTSGGVTKEYDLSSADGENSADLTKDWPDGIDRTADYTLNLTIDIQKTLAQAGTEKGSNGYYTVASGDSFTMNVSGLLRENASFSGRLQDTTAAWGSSHDGVGDYEIHDGKLTLSFDDGYLAEKQGEILRAVLQFAGGFNLDDQTTDEFTTDVGIGNVTIHTKFPALEIVRNLSIEKSGDTYGETDGGRVSQSTPSYPRANSANVDSDGYLTYTVKVTAQQDNTFKLTNVKVTDLFDDASKVDLSTMKLVSVTKDGSSYSTSSAVPLYDASGNVNGWNIGDLAVGESATVTYKVKISKDGLTSAVDVAKAKNPSTDASDARTIKNTASAVADDTDAVTDDYATTVANCITVNKHTDSYDGATQTEYFTITVLAPASNRYTEHNVPVHDYFSSGALDAKYYKESGVKSMTVTHSDGSTEDLTWGNYSHPNSTSWYATIPEMRPGDVVKIVSYTTVNDSYWTHQAANGYVGNTAKTYNHVYVGNLGENGLYASDLNRTYDYTSFILAKAMLAKNQPSVNANGTVSWAIVGNEAGKSATPVDVGGKTLVDQLGADQVFDDGTARVTFYNQDGSVAGSDSIPLTAGSTSFTYTIPEQYGTCGYRIAYTARISDWDTYVGPSKTYSNYVGYLDGSWGYTGVTYERPRVAAMDKVFVQQADDWSQWRTSIYSDLQAGDTYTDTSREGVSYMYFTPEDLADITLTIDGIAVDPSLYRIEPTSGSSSEDGQYNSYTITFTGDVGVSEDGAQVTPSKAHPLVVDYKAHMLNPPADATRNYHNDATLTAGNVTDTDYDYCRRANRYEVRKSVQSSSNGTVSWFVKANYYGYSAQPDGTCTITDTLPAGLQYVSAHVVDRTDRGQIDSITPVANDDGTTTLTIKASGLQHDEVSKNHPSDNNNDKEFHFVITTKITDPDYLYGTTAKQFDFTNTVSLNDRYGNPKSSTATAQVQHVGMQKDMVYTTATAPYANFSIVGNQDGADLNPDGDTVDVVDRLSASLALDVKSFSVVNAVTGTSLPFTLDTSKFASDHEVTVSVPDGTPVKITYRAQVSGLKGESVQVENSAWWKGHDSEGQKVQVSKTVDVLNGQGQAESVPMVWLSKCSATDASALGGASFKLERYSAADGWTLVRDGITTTADDSVPGIQVGGLNLDVLYRLIETAAPSGYALDQTPYYFVLGKTAGENVEYPDDFGDTSVLKGPAGIVVTAYDEPYVPVSFEKMSSDGVRLADATLQVLSEDGSVAQAKTAADADATQDAEFASSADGTTVFYLAPGAYKLHEKTPPSGYRAAGDIAFTVSGNGEVTMGDQQVSVVTMSDESRQTSISVTKVWRDGDDADGVRPGSVTAGLFADYGDGAGTVDTGNRVQVSAAGPDGRAGTDDDWTAAFEGLDVMRAGKPVAYSVREIDASGAAVADGGAVDGHYAAAVSGDAEHGFAIVNTDTDSVEVRGAKTWDDAGDQDGVRPDSVTVRLHASNAIEPLASKTVTAADAESSDPDTWSYSFGELPKFDAQTGERIVYTVTEDAVDGYSSSTIDGLSWKNTHEPGKTSVTVTKVWRDGDDADGVRPSSVQMQLFGTFTDADGSVRTRPVGDPVSLSADSAWLRTWSSLDVYEPGQAGSRVTYTVKEIDAATGQALESGDQLSDGTYIVSISGDAVKGYVVTNSHEPALKAIDAPGQGSEDGGSSSQGGSAAQTESKVPLTGDGLTIIVAVFAAFGSLMAFGAAVAARRKANGKASERR